MWTENARPTLYGQWLAWQVTIEHSVEPADGVEPVEFVKTGTCFGRDKAQMDKERA